MSDVEAYKGRVTTTNKTLHEFMEGVKFPTWYDKNNWYDVYEYFCDLYNREYVLIGKTVYKVSKAPFDPESISEFEENEDGSIDFMVSFYNGGVSFGEVIERGVEKLQNKKEIGGHDG